MKKLKENIVLFLSLFTSLSTLLCCALPALLVLLGFGAVFAGLTASIPQIIWLAERKGLLFSIGGILLVLAHLKERNNIIYPAPQTPLKRVHKHLVVKKTSIHLVYILCNWL